MKKHFILFILLLSNLNIVCAQQKFSETEKLTSFAKVWGFLKYYHPNVVNQQMDWDKELIEIIPEIEAINSEKELNEFYTNWIHSLGTFKNQKTNKEKGETFDKNFDLSWIDNQFSDTPELIDLLKNIENNRKTLDGKILFKIDDNGFRYFIEKSYSKNNLNQKEYRLLDLFRYWNIIEYFYPYKYLIHQNWDDVLIEMLPKFIQKESEEDYTYLLFELFAKIDDGHAYFSNDCNPNCFGEYWVPFDFIVIDNQIVINDLYKIKSTQEFQKGDIILKINGENAFEVLNQNLKYSNGSNLPGKYRNMYGKLFNGDTDKINLRIQRGNEIIEKDFNRLKYEEFDFSKNPNPEKWKILNHNIGYLNIGKLEIQDVETAYEEIKDTKAVIIDVRNYPNGTLVNLMQAFSAKPEEFSSYTTQDLKYPGKFRWRENPPIGRKNKNPYSGKIIILANEKTQSQAETIVMALQTLENSTTIGSQTSGSNGNVSVIPMVFEGMETWISGIGFYYADKSEIQRKGVKIDIEINPTIEGLRNGKDEVLERAIEFIETGK